MQTANNTVLITGGGSGIGLALATAFLEKGNNVLIAGRDENRLKSATKQIPNMKWRKCDISKAEERDKLVLEIERNYPKLNILVNNAGVQYNYHSVEEFSTSQKLVNELQTNLIAPIELSRLLLPTLLNQDEAAIVNITSALALIPKKNAPGYCASKGGLHI